MESPIPPDPYVALGVSSTATANEIKQAYRKLVLKCHPDKIADETLKAKAVEDFHKVQQAYELVGDEEKRSRYDALIRLAELRKQKLEMRGSEMRSPTTYDIRTAAPPQSSFSPRGMHRSYTFDERRPSHYSDEEQPRSSARKSSAYAYVRRSPLEKERERERERDSDRARRDDERRRSERRRDVDREADRSTKYSSSNEEFARYEESRRRRDKEETKPSLRREGTEERTSRVFEEAQAYINSQRPTTSRTSSSYGYTRRAPAEGPSRRSGREPSPRDDRRGPQIVSPTTSRPSAFETSPKKPEPHRSYTAQTDYERRRETEEPVPLASMHRSYTMPTQPAASSSRKAPAPKLRTDIPDSGYSSPAVTPERQMPPPPPGGPSAVRTTLHHYPDQSSSKATDSKYQTIYREPPSSTASARRPSPSRMGSSRSTNKTASMMANLASGSSSNTSTRVPPKRSSTTYSYSEMPSARGSPRVSRSPERLSTRDDRERSRRDRPREEARDKLYGEIPSVREPRMRASASPEEMSRRRYGRDDSSYSYSRDTRDTRGVDDYRYPPKLGRTSTTVF